MSNYQYFQHGISSFVTWYTLGSSCSEPSFFSLMELFDLSIFCNRQGFPLLLAPHSIQIAHVKTSINMHGKTTAVTTWFFLSFKWVVTDVGVGQHVPLYLQRITCSSLYVPLQSWSHQSHLEWLSHSCLL